MKNLKNSSKEGGAILIKNKRKTRKSLKESFFPKGKNSTSKKKEQSKKKYYFNMDYSKNIFKNDFSPSEINSLTLKHKTSKNSEINKLMKNINVSPNNKKSSLFKKTEICPKSIITGKHKNEYAFKENEITKLNKKSQVLKDLIKNIKNPLQSVSKSPSPNSQKTTLFSKLRIVSKEKRFEQKKSSSRKKLDLKFDKKNQAFILKHKQEKKLNIKELYKRLRNLPEKEKARSNELQRKKKINVSNCARKNKFLSEDKDQTKYILAEKANLNLVKNTKKNKKSSISEISKNTNKYFQRFISLYNNNEAGFLKKNIKERFNNWKKYDLAELFDFKTSINFYKIKKQIGKGCFGRVYLATQILTNSEVALKVIEKKSLSNKESQLKIEKEVKILKEVNFCDYIIKLHEVFEDQDYVYMVFELMPNGDLVQFFKKRSLFEEEELIPFFKKILIGVKHLHDNNIIHRDIKLDNILLDKHKNPKIIDFGISSILDNLNKIFDTGGTPAYLAPEVIKAEGEVCFKSDVWSLGVLLYLLNYGLVPFQSDDIQKLYNKIIVGKFKFPKNDYSSIELVDVINKMLVVDIDKRYCIEKVLKHPLFKKYETNKLLEKENENSFWDKKATDFEEDEKKTGIFLFLQYLGFHQDFIQQSIDKNLFNHVKVCLDVLMKKSF